MDAIESHTEASRVTAHSAPAAWGQVLADYVTLTKPRVQLLLLIPPVTSLLALACQGRGREMDRFSEQLVPGPLLRAEPLALAALTRFPLPGEEWVQGQRMHAIFEEVAARRAQVPEPVALVRPKPEVAD